MPRVTFIPDDVIVDVVHGENLLRAAMMADVQVTATCGGDGTCGKCRMIVEQGEAQSSSSARLTDAQVASGYVLGCTTEVTDNLVVRIPPEARPGAAPSHTRSRRAVAAVLTAEEHATRLPATKSDPPARKLYA
ncbi:MAG: 2Fe-2S iron-sulfur cluster binding domain-containing protein, partial [Coriobacteriia bacterium]|nr:2Fe-2S iron-sulfur cluster binding domain-containing protein [Coriobacteriia bacterium]